MTLNVEFLVRTFFVALSGVPIALLVTVVALLFSVPVSFLLALTRINKVPIFSQLSRIYVSFVRGTPIIVQIFIIYNSVPLMLSSTLKQLNFTLNVEAIHPVWYAFIIFSFNTTALLIEVFRSALQTVDDTQYEAGLSVGLSRIHTYRRIIIPQILVTALPNLSTATINLIKATSLGYAISLYEITLRAKVEANFGYHYLEAYIDIFIVYLIVCSLVEYAYKRLENHVSKYKQIGGVRHA
ncbi:MAG TPA: amino acid ABC transporter permease [Virgibacillus sp.]|nr:amino acid ABC transporter permease [Virgibacillus sp.]